MSDMRKVGDVFAQDNFGAKVFYKVTSIDDNGMEVAELLVGYVPPTVVEDIIDEIKEVKEVKKVPKTADKKPIKKK